MDVVVERLFADAEATIGVVRVGTPVCFSLEDQWQPAGRKIPGETRIPAGIYPLRVRAHGGFHTRYAERFGPAHRGMLEICDVPNFTDILIHCGNTNADTAGCLLVGMGAQMEPGALSLQNNLPA